MASKRQYEQGEAVSPADVMKFIKKETSSPVRPATINFPIKSDIFLCIYPSSIIMGKKNFANAEEKERGNLLSKFCVCLFLLER